MTSVRRTGIVLTAALMLGAGLGWWALRDPGSAPAAPPSTDRLVRADRDVPASALRAQIETALNTHDGAEWEQVLHEWFPALVAEDRAAARRLVEDLPPGETREQMVRRLARVWAATDFAGAVAWIAGLTDPAEQKAAMEDACFQVAETNPVEAIRAWAALDFTADDHVLENLVQSWAEKDVTAARAWVSAQPSSKQRDQAVARVAYVWAQSRPADAAGFVIRELPPGPAQTEAAISILHQWARHDRAGASAWVHEFPAGPLADRARDELVGIAHYQVGGAP